MSNARQYLAVLGAGLRQEILCEVFPEGMIVLEDGGTPLFSAEPPVFDLEYRLLEESASPYGIQKSPRRSGQKSRQVWPRLDKRSRDR